MPFTFPTDEAAIAYAAGLFEGEGTIASGSKTFRTASGELRDRLTPQFSFAIGMTDLEPLERWQEAMGGIGKIYGPYFKQHWRLYLCKKAEIIQACELMWPYLSPRRQEQIRAVIGEVRELAVS